MKFLLTKLSVEPVSIRAVVVMPLTFGVRLITDSCQSRSIGFKLSSNRCRKAMLILLRLKLLKMIKLLRLIIVLRLRFRPTDRIKMTTSLAVAASSFVSRTLRPVVLTFTTKSTNLGHRLIIIGTKISKRISRLI